MDLILVGIGGAAGSLVRFGIGKIIAQRSGLDFPAGTFIINISGAVLLGLVTGFNPGRNSALLLADGFLGAYTTFSTFMYEGFNMFKENEKKNAFVYILCTLIFGIAGYTIGYALSKLMRLF